jgi:hypothetical protein
VAEQGGGGEEERAPAALPRAGVGAAINGAQESAAAGSLPLKLESPSRAVADRCPDLPTAIVQRGHSVSAHGRSQGTLPAYLTAGQGAAEIARCMG